MMEIQVKVRKVYGNEIVDPVCDTAKALCSLTGNKTFTMHALATIKELGYTFRIVSNGNELSRQLVSTIGA